MCTPVRVPIIQEIPFYNTMPHKVDFSIEEVPENKSHTFKILGYEGARSFNVD